MLWTIVADERAALQLDDLASALDAGLPLASLGGDSNRGELVLHDILDRRGVRLTNSEAAVLQAAWQAGNGGNALRARAEQRRQHADFLRRIWAGIRYPLIVLATAAVTTVITLPVHDNSPLMFGVGLGLVLLVLAVVLVHRGWRVGGEGWLRLPVVGAIGRDLAELPYLETLQSLYGAGVPLAKAHQAAVANIGFAAVRKRLDVADRAVQEGRRLGEGLAEAQALHLETRGLLTTGEQAGQLEDALGRALQRRRAVITAATTRAAKLGGSILYAGAVVVVFIIVYTFYSTILGIRR